MPPAAIAAALHSSSHLAPARLRLPERVTLQRTAPRRRWQGQARRRGALALGSVEKPLDQGDVLELFDLLRQAAQEDDAMTIRLTARPGSLASLVDALARADERHGVVVDLLWEAAEREAVWDDLVRLSVRGLFVRLLFLDAPDDRDWEPWVRRARAFGAADVTLDPRAGGEAAERLDRWRLAYALPQVPVGRG